MKESLKILGSRWFLLALAVLLVNDHFLKYQFNNWFTGKLSDFAGLFAFTLFWLALIPRFRLGAVIGCGLFFVFWKSHWSQPTIDWVNGWSVVRLNRVVDPSDLLALLVLPVAYYYSRCQRVKLLFNKKMAIYGVGLIAFTGFCATSISHYIDYNKDYDFDIPVPELLDRLNGLHIPCENQIYSFDIEQADTFQIYGSDTTYFSYSAIDTMIDTMYQYKQHWLTGESKKMGVDTVYTYYFFDKDTIYIRPGDTINFNIPECDCVSVRFSIDGDMQRSAIHLVGISGRYCYDDKLTGSDKQKRRIEKEMLLVAFEKKLIGRLRAVN